MTGVAEWKPSMNVSVDKDLCIGCELCTTVCPALFQMNAAGTLAVAKTASVPKSLESCAGSAADQCPVTAIALS